MEVNSMSIGPIHFDREKQEVALAPGLYRLNSRIVFGIVADTEIKDLEYRGLSAQVDPHGTTLNRHATDSYTGEISAVRIGAEEFAVG